ncbi:MAG: TldD/PmbA family protein [Chloroflexota bacterium]
MTDLRNLLTDAVKRPDVDFLEIRFEDEDVTAFTLHGDKVDEVSQAENRVGNVRALVRGGWGFVSFNDLTRLGEWVDQAVAQARLAAGGQRDIARVAPVVDITPAQLIQDPRQVPLAEKIALIREYNSLALGVHPVIKTSIATYWDIFQRRYYANSDGAYIEKDKLFERAGFSIVAREGDAVETMASSISSVRGWQDFAGKHAQIRDAVERAKELPGAPSVKAGIYTVVLDPGMTGLFVHEAFGHLSEADGVFDNQRLRDVMQLGRRFGSPILSVSDGGVHPDLFGTFTYDDEGVPCQDTSLIREGILTGRLHSRETARAMGEQPTGNARAISYQFPPIVRMTNTFIHNGETPVDEIIADVKDGLYIRGTKGGMTMKEQFTFAAQEAWEIHDGKIAGRVKDVVLSGNLFETLKNIDAIGNDFTWRFGSCGKGGQAMIPVGMGGPTIRIRNVVVGGK